MFELKGFDKINKTLSELQKLSNELNGELGVIKFDAKNAESIELALVEMEVMINKKFESYQANSIAKNMADGIKESYRQMVLNEASEARLNAGNEEEDYGS